jgi:hypothetical protein
MSFTDLAIGIVEIVLRGAARAEKDNSARYMINNLFMLYLNVMRLVYHGYERSC